MILVEFGKNDVESQPLDCSLELQYYWQWQTDAMIESNWQTDTVRLTNRYSKVAVIIAKKSYGKESEKIYYYYFLYGNSS